jgi:2-hydroxychromene-2-carboxylate isomerase
MAVVEVFADVGCPFAHVGLVRLRQRREALGRTDVVVRVRAWPLELVNGKPLDGEVIAEEVEEIRAQAAPDLFAHFGPAGFPASTLPAMALAARAYEAGDATGERMSFALRRALFEDGADLGDPAVVLALAREHGVEPPEPGDRAAVLADWEEGRARGVIGSPHFFAGGEGFFCPALDIQKEDGHLRITADPESFAAFVERCFTE